MIDGIHHDVYVYVCNPIWYAEASKTKSNLISCRFSFDAIHQPVASGIQNSWKPYLSILRIAHSLYHRRYAPKINSIKSTRPELLSCEIGYRARKRKKQPNEKKLIEHRSKVSMKTDFLHLIVAKMYANKRDYFDEISNPWQ